MNKDNTQENQFLSLLKRIVKYPAKPHSTKGVIERAFFMFIVSKSPRGGKWLGNLFSTVSNKVMIYKPDNKPKELGDYLAWKIGWAEEDLKRGDPIHMRRSDARHLMKLLKEYVE